MLEQLNQKSVDTVVQSVSARIRISPTHTALSKDRVMNKSQAVIEK